MTCEDCIHFTNKKVENMGDTDLVFCDAFDKDSVTRASQWANECKSFENNDGTYSNGTWHCPRCGVSVKKWGLCDKCEDLWESESNPIDLTPIESCKDCKHHSSESYRTFPCMECYNHNSWESVSK